MNLIEPWSFAFKLPPYAGRNTERGRDEGTKVQLKSCQVPISGREGQPTRSGQSRLDRYILFAGNKNRHGRV